MHMSRGNVQTNLEQTINITVDKSSKGVDMHSDMTAGGGDDRGLKDDKDIDKDADVE